MNDKIIPMPIKFGVGFVSQNQLPPDLAGAYRYEQVGRYHNYHVTADKWDWPENQLRYYDIEYIIDGFSPNMNKELHVGHLRNLAIARSLADIFGQDKFVALLGCSQGVKKAALEGWKWWTNFVNYHPKVYYDVVLPQDVIETRNPTSYELEENINNVAEGFNGGPKLWDGPKGSMIVIRSNGSPLYAFYDLLFAKEVGPTHYITGHEQKEHFASLGLADKHLPMGLVLGTDGKKMKSRTGDALSATEALSMITQHLRDLQEPKSLQVAWNIAAWNFLHAARETNLKFEVEKWVRPESPGMYITYTYARVSSALKPDRTIGSIYDYHDPITEDDAKLLGLSDQYNHYYNKSVQKMDPAPIANFAHDLAKALNVAYEKEKICGGREAFCLAIHHATGKLKACMDALGMFILEEI